MSEVVQINAKHILNSDEMKAVAEEISRTQGEIEQLDAERKAAANEFKAKLEVLQAQLSAKCETHRNGFDWRYQPARRVKDYAEGVIRYIHAETGILLKEETMPYEERQRHFFDGEDD